MALVFIASTTASASTTLEFTSGIDSTYNEYQFQFVNMHPATNGAEWQFQVNAAGESGFNETITSTMFRAYIQEDGVAAPLQYQENYDQAQGTGYQQLTDYTGNDNDGSASGMLTLYAPSSTTYVKHFMATIQDMYGSDSCTVWYAAGYINTTAAIDEISFMFDNGNTDAGTIYMYGVG